MSDALNGGLAGRVVLISGATGGLGYASAVACAQAGATVILQGRKLAKLHRVYDQIVAAGGDAALYPLDMEGASPDDYVEMGERIAQEFGKLDGLLHAAAHFRALTPLALTDPADSARALHINVTAPLWLTQGVLPAMQHSNDAAIIMCMDDPTRTSRAFWGGYGLAQPARAALVQSLHGELADHIPVRVHGLMPGPMRTELRARAFMEDRDAQVRPPQHYAPAVVELLSAAGKDRAGTVWSPAP